MPEQFPRLNLDGPADLEHVLTVVRQHAHKVAQMEFGKDLDRDKTLKSTVDKVVGRLTLAAKYKVERNLLFNGMSPSDYARQTKGIEPFDEDLSRRVQSLAEQSDKLTEEVIAYRKTLPSRRAEAMEKRAAVIKAMEMQKEEQRRDIESANLKALEQRSKPLALDLERRADIAQTLQKSVQDVTGLQTSILEQATAATEQARLVKRLRTMPP